MLRRLLICALILGSAGISSISRADGASDNLPDSVRRVPPPGIKVSDTDHAMLQEGIDSLGNAIEGLKSSLKTQPKLLALLPDVQIYHNAARYALNNDEFYSPREIETAKAFLKQGMQRAELLKVGSAPWAVQTGLVARGYHSKIDGSVQPYGLVIPANYQVSGGKPIRLDFWFHGRGENLTELNFINDRQRSMGDFTPPDTIVLHLYGRYCNANKFAGETDLFEVLDSVRHRYQIDEDRLVVRGFSMGGAACWQFASHFAGEWAAAAPGAGFSETPDFLKVFQNEIVKPTWYEQKLWHIYDGVDYAENIFNCPTVAYSGELDGQRQAADMMAKAMKAEGLDLVQVIGPGAHHFYEANAKKEVARMIDELAAKGRDNAPRKVRFTTWTLRYNKMKWITIDGMEKHWDRAHVDGEIADGSNSHGVVTLNTRNVSALTFRLLRKLAPVSLEHPIFNVDGQKLTINYARLSDIATPNIQYVVHLRKNRGKWAVVPTDDVKTLAKKHGLQGPIDDAFMDSFIMVKPTGTPMNAKVGAWADGEMKHAIEHWRRQYRGEARVKNDTEINSEDIASSNLVLWGDPSSNKLIAKIISRLPIGWNDKSISVGSASYASDHNMPVLIYPNPLNPNHYIVLNSGFTFREYDYLNNARQNAKLPDWAIVDINTPPSSRWPGKIVDANFFGERWELTPKQNLARTSQ